jgi:hypothetical protein
MQLLADAKKINGQGSAAGRTSSYKDGRSR